MRNKSLYLFNITYKKVIINKFISDIKMII